MMKKMNTTSRPRPFRGLWISILLVALLLLTPLCVVIGLGLGLPDQYRNTFTAALPDKMERLSSVDSPKIVVIGGSSVAFGLDSTLMEAQTGRPTVNFGLYASLGTKAMMELSRDHIREGDIILLSPETDPQTLSTFFGAEVMWQALEADRSLVRHLSFDSQKQMALSFWDYTVNKCRLFRTGTPDPDGIYRRDSFDALGDLAYERPRSRLKLGYDPGQIISLTRDIVSPEFISFVNEYVAWAHEQGAEVYFTYAPMNRAALSPDTTEDSLYAYYCYLASALDCEVITDIHRAIMEPGYFYDSNFHLNDSGRTVWTAHLAEDVRRTLGMASPGEVSLPPAPPLAENGSHPSGYDVNQVYFTYRDVRNQDGEIAWYSVSGLTEEGRAMESLTLPLFADGIPVHSVEAGAFAGATSLKEITLLENIYSISSGAFADCPSLTKLHIYNDDASTMMVDQMTLFDGANPSLKIYLYSQESYESYVTGYFWGNYAGKMVLVK